MNKDLLTNIFDLHEIEKCIEIASAMREKSYSPYSNYTVGAAALFASGTIYTGCNIENASYGGTICAERTAIFKGVSEGEKALKMITVVGGRAGDPADFAYPCGFCRQVMREFSEPENLYIIVAKNAKEWEAYTLEELLPHSFGPDFKEY